MCVCVCGLYIITMLIYFYLTPSDQYLLSHRDVVKHSFFLSFVSLAFVGSGNLPSCFV